MPALLVLITGAGGYLATAWGLWNLRQWGQASAIALAVLVLFIQLLGLLMLQGTPLMVSNIVLPSLLYAAAAIGIIVYLLQPGIRAVFVGNGTAPDWAPGTRCPHCQATGLAPGMVVCPFCRGSLIAAPVPLVVSNTGSSTGTGRAVSPTIVEPPQAGPQAWLTIRSGPGAGRRFDLSRDSEIGRERDCAIRLSDDDRVSRRHARLQAHDGQFYIRDIGSSAGTYVNGRQVDKARMLYDGDVIVVGETSLEFKRSG